MSGLNIYHFKKVLTATLIKSSASLVSNFSQTSISYVNSIKLNFNQSATVNLKTSEVMCILNKRHVISK
jgi:hypothetical protein